MEIEIFDVGHGACAVATDTNGKRLMVDCGHHADRPWYPSVEYKDKPIESLVISNFDEDHVSDLPDLAINTAIGSIIYNNTVKSSDLEAMKKDEGAGKGIQWLINWMKDIESNPRSYNPSFNRMTAQHFWGSYPTECTTENNLSIASVVESYGFRILFSGDLEKTGWENLLNYEPFIRSIERGVTIFVASHHGRETGYRREVFEVMNYMPAIIIMSDRDKQFDSQETYDLYRPHCTGIDDTTGKTHYILTTRNNGDIKIEVDQNGNYRLEWARS